MVGIDSFIDNIIERKDISPEKDQDSEEHKITIIEETPEEKKVRRSLAYSVMDGSFYSAMVGFGESIFSMFAIFLKATSVQLGLISSLPQTLGSIFQLFARNILEKFPSRKSYVLFFAFLQVLCMLPLPLAYFFFKGNFMVYLLILVSMYYITGMLINPAWTSWMGDLVPGHVRGSYFGKRNAITSAVSFITMMIGGFLLSYFTKSPIVGFTLLFMLASLMRFFSWIFLSLQYEPPSKGIIHNNVTLKEFLSEADMQNYGIFILIMSLMNIAVYVASPFFIAYMHNDLGYSYTLIAVVNAIAILVKFLFNPLWGKLCDRFSSQKIFTISAFLMPAVPILWVFSPSLVWIVFAQIFSGFAWSAWEISSANFIFEMVPKNKRVSSSSYMNLFAGIGILIGGILGGFLISQLKVLVVGNPVIWSKYFIVFLVSGILRYAVSFTFIPKVKDTKIVEPVSSSRFLQVMFASAFPTTGVSKYVVPRKSHEENHEMLHTVIVNEKDTIKEISEKIENSDEKNSMNEKQESEKSAPDFHEETR